MIKELGTGIYRLSEKEKKLFDYDIAIENGYEEKTGHADGQNHWRYDCPETGLTLFGSSDACEESGKQYTEIPETYKELFLN